MRSPPRRESAELAPGSEAHAPSIADRPSATSKAATSPSALVLDADRWTARLVESVLGLRGYAVHHAPDAEQGLALALRLRPDVLIVDAALPAGVATAGTADASGEGLRALRERPELADAAWLVLVDPLVVGGEAALRDQAARLGIGEVLAKPFLLAALDAGILRAQATAGERARPVERTAEAAPSHTAPATLPSYPAGIFGTLDQLGLASLLAMLEFERKSGVLRTLRGASVGRLVCRHGRVTTAVLLSGADAAPVRGAEAVYQLLGWADGRFEFVPAGSAAAAAMGDDADDEITVPTSFLLMEGARRLDEGRRRDGEGR